MGFRRLGVLRYVQAGYALVIQQVRGIGASEGHFSFNAPHEREDGFDTVQWIAAQAWCNGAVGMDGSSYVAMTQLAAAASRPPALRCAIPAAPSLDFFREAPYCGGIFSRLHTLNWTHLLQIDSLAEQRGGFMGLMPVLTPLGDPNPHDGGPVATALVQTPAVQRVFHDEQHPSCLWLPTLQLGTLPHHETSK